jgi:hypothetical protein
MTNGTMHCEKCGVPWWLGSGHAEAWETQCKCKGTRGCTCGVPKEHKVMPDEEARKCRTCDEDVILRQVTGHVQRSWKHVGKTECSTRTVRDNGFVLDILSEQDTYKAQKGREGFDYCTHDAEPDYCDGCLCIRQRHHGKGRARVKLAVARLDALIRPAPAYPTVPKEELVAIRALLMEETK